MRQMIESLREPRSPEEFAAALHLILIDNFDVTVINRGLKLDCSFGDIRDGMDATITISDGPNGEMEEPGESDDPRRS
jgi:hypothetical protein